MLYEQTRRFVCAIYCWFFVYKPFSSELIISFTEEAPAATQEVGDIEGEPKVIKQTKPASKLLHLFS